MSQKDLRAIEELHQKDVEASRSRDFRTLRSLFTEDAVLMPPGGARRRGAKELDRSFAGMSSAYSQVEILEYEQIFDEVEICGNLAVEWGWIRGATRSLADGKVERTTYHLMRVLKRQPDGSWKIHRSIWNSAGEDDEEERSEP